MILTVFDTETSGLNPDKHEILEIGLLSFIVDGDGNEHILKQYEQKIKPERIDLANPKALEVNGYSEEAWSEAIPFHKAMREAGEIITGSDILLGQNLIFDIRFLDEMCKRNSIDVLNYPAYIDTKSMADRLVRGEWLQRSGMDYLVEHYNVTTKGRAHTALADCWRTFEVWKKLLVDCGEEYDVFTADNPYDYYARRNK